MSITKEMLAKMIEHTAVRLDTKEDDIIRIVRDAKENCFGAVVVNSSYVMLAEKLIKNASVKLVSTVSFPFGCASSRAKAQEGIAAIEDGADEIDMVMNLGKFKSKNYDYVESDIFLVVKMIKKHGKSMGKDVVVKVIIETPYLDKDEIYEASKIVEGTGADFIKTSTGFGHRNTMLEDVKIIRKAVGKNVGIKASGGIKTYEDAKKMIEAGAIRIGTSASIDIIRSCPV